MSSLYSLAMSLITLVNIMRSDGSETRFLLRTNYLAPSRVGFTHYDLIGVGEVVVVQMFFNAVTASRTRCDESRRTDVAVTVIGVSLGTGTIGNRYGWKVAPGTVVLELEGSPHSADPGILAGRFARRGGNPPTLLEESDTLG